MGIVQEITTHFGNAVIAPIGPRDRKIGISPIEYKLSYINNLSVPITVVWRSGLKFVLPPQFSMTCNKLLVRTEIIIHHSVRQDVQRLLSSINDEASNELKVMREAFSYQLKDNTYGGAVLIIDFPVTIEKLHELGGTLYFNELDCLFSLNDFDSAPPHPFSDEGRKLNLINTNTGADNFTYSIELIDNVGKYGPRYLNIGNKIYKVNITKDNTKRDGIYITSNNSIDNELSDNDKVVKHYSFEGSEEKLGLYRTIEEAKNLGDTSLARKYEMSKLEHESALIKAELQHSKHAQDLMVIERTREMHAAEMEREKHAREIEEIRQKAEHDLKMARERAKDFYEERSYQRKDSNEILKYIPAIITVIGSIAMILKSTK